MKCVESVSSKLIVVSENHRSVRFSNTRGSAFERGQVDGCLITGANKRCDAYLRNDEVVWLIELKGRDVEKAIDQIVSTTKLIKYHIGDREIIPVIVATRCPAISGNQKILKKLKNISGNYNNNIVLRSRVAKISV